MPKLIENAKEKIIIQGRKTLLEEGYKGLNIREIAKQCDIGTGTFYNYFRNKIELVIEIFQDDWNKTLNIIESLELTDEPFKEKIRKIYESLQGFVDDYISIFYEIANEEKQGYHCREKDSFTKLYKKIGDLIELERKKGNITSKLDSEKLSYFIISNLTYLSKNKYMSFDELYDHLKI